MNASPDTVPLQGAIMLCESLDSTELDGTIYDLATVWSDDFDPI